MSAKCKACGYEGLAKMEVKHTGTSDDCVRFTIGRHSCASCGAGIDDGDLTGPGAVATGTGQVSASAWVAIRLSDRIREGLKVAPSGSQTFTWKECVLLFTALRVAHAAVEFADGVPEFERERYAEAFGKFKTEEA